MYANLVFIVCLTSKIFNFILSIAILSSHYCKKLGHIKVQRYTLNDYPSDFKLNRLRVNGVIGDIECACGAGCRNSLS